ncbi:regulator of protease activity HflC (stomatin/prohibitin superfamily) [Streptomyces aurantiacus]|uniref:slipin family protein n=1 Tax=Streptomyces aurantiacus TaxID=47760 RepID=UPI00278FC729|nr:slipin family protein [Streptomyces aurantiacus]MDQ0778255.1 regulator of protease activity HflC (stomatin/prohibitin superfamily) [Streptomyces aurantiacus]
MIEELVTAGVTLASVGAVYAMAAARVVKQYERGVVLRLGRLRSGVRGPGFTLIVPFVDRLQKVNMQIVTMPVPGQDGITRDNVTVRVDAVIYFKVVSAADAVIKVEDYRFAVSQMAQTSLRSIIGKSELDDLLSNREKLNQGLELMIDSPAVEWGVSIDRVEIKDVSLPETMKRSMARQAEADRERRARVINADAELQASKKLAEAAGVMSEQPAALQLRLLQTVVAVAAEKNSTLVLPFPVELLRFLERAQPAPQPQPAQQQVAQPARQQVADSAHQAPRPAAENQPSLSESPQSLPGSEQQPPPGSGQQSIRPQDLSAQAQQLLAQWQQSMQEQLPPVEAPLDPDFRGSKSGQD